MKTRLLIIVVAMSMLSTMINSAYGCERDDRLDYVLPWKYEYIDQSCYSQLQISWIGLLIWIIMGFLLYNFALVLLEKKTMWQRK
jgi:ABC-type Fe3+-siderophore transport system permease subunit